MKSSSKLLQSDLDCCVGGYKEGQRLVAGETRCIKCTGQKIVDKRSKMPYICTNAKHCASFAYHL